MSEIKKEIALDKSQMHLLDHLAELRKRLFYCAIGLILGASLAYYYIQPIFDFLSKPYFDAFISGQLIGTGPAEVFVLKLKLAVFAGFLISAPLTFYQFWLFIAPGLLENEKKLALPFVFFSTALFLSGAMFCYYVVFPFAFEFFAKEYVSVNISPNIKIGEHLSFVSQGILVFGAVFELPILAYFLARIGIVSSKMLIGGVRYAVVAIFIVAAILTPPDVLTQFLLAIPLMILYAVSILVVKFVERKQQKLELIK